MKTSIQLTTENAFQIKRVGTKRADEFKHNIITRPLTLNCALLMLTSHSEATLKDFKHLSLVVNKWATDFHTDTKSDAKLEVSFGKYAKLIFGKNTAKREISLDASFFETYTFLKNQELYTTEL